MIAKYELIKFRDEMLFDSSVLSYIETVSHWHREFEFIFMISGRIDASINGENFNLTEGEIMIVNSNEIHSYISDINEKNKIHVMHISKIFLLI